MINEHQTMIQCKDKAKQMKMQLNLKLDDQMVDPI